MKTKWDIINSMCLTYDHRYTMISKEELDKDDYWSKVACLSKEEKQSIYRQMKQIYENDIEPYMSIK
jgi:hypothetical protein